MTHAGAAARTFLVSVPGKTFLVGEYLALRGGPSLLMATEPRFQFRVRVDARSGRGETVGLHPDSPAARWWARFGEGLLTLDEPATEAGPEKGFGRSTAEYVAVVSAARALRTPETLLPMAKTSFHSMVDEYRATVEAGRPSGADLIAQWVGGLTWWGPSHDIFSSSLVWPWPEIGLGIIRLSDHLTTHEHIAEIEKSRRLDDSLSGMRAAAVRAYEQFSRAHEATSQSGSEPTSSGPAFAREVQDFGLLLRRAGWQTDLSRELCDQMRLVPGVIAAKGCGAMGADVLAFLTDKRVFQRDERGPRGLEKVLQGGQRGKLVGSEQSLSAGVEVQTI